MLKQGLQNRFLSDNLKPFSFLLFLVIIISFQKTWSQERFVTAQSLQFQKTFNREEAFKRTIGWITPDELKVLSNKTVAIAGVGGVGGAYALTMARLGVGKFVLADPDTFDIVNLNRQKGSKMSTLGRYKVDVIAEEILDINPEAEVIVYRDFISEKNIESFADSADIFLDGLDFYAFKARETVFNYFTQHGKSVVTAAPVGMGASLLVFTPESMSFKDYFGLHTAQSKLDLSLRFLLGVAPSSRHDNYLVYPEGIDFVHEKTPSTPMAIDLCAGVIGTEALKILLRRGEVVIAPVSLHFDAFNHTYIRTELKHGYIDQEEKFQQLRQFYSLKLGDAKP